MKHDLKTMKEQMISVYFDSGNYYDGYVLNAGNTEMLLALSDDTGTYAGIAYVPVRTIRTIKTNTKRLHKLESLWEQQRLPVIPVTEHHMLQDFCNYLKKEQFLLSLGYHSDLKSDRFGTIEEVFEDKLIIQLYDEKKIWKDGISQIGIAKIERIVCDMKTKAETKNSEDSPERSTPIENILTESAAQNKMVAISTEFMNFDAFDAGYVGDYSSKEFSLIRIGTMGQYDGIAVYCLDRTLEMEMDTKYLQSLEHASKGILSSLTHIPTYQTKSLVLHVLHYALENKKLILLKMGHSNLEDVLGRIETIRSGIVKVKTMSEEQWCGVAHIKTEQITELLCDTEELRSLEADIL